MLSIHSSRLQSWAGA